MSFTSEIRASVAKNRLYLRMVGFMTDDDARRVADTIINEFQKLKPGFDVINDISGLKPASKAAADEMRRAQEASFKHGHRRIIRVVVDQAVTHLQWSRTLTAASPDQSVETAATVEEAERMLEEPRRGKPM